MTALSGRRLRQALLPRLLRQGFHGRIPATLATIDLCSCLLPDAGHIQESEVEILYRRSRRRRRAAVAPICAADHAERARALFSAVDYGAWLTPAPGLRARRGMAAMLDLASIELEFALPRECEHSTSRCHGAAPNVMALDQAGARRFAIDLERQ